MCRIKWTLCEDPKRLIYAQDMMTVKPSDIETNRLKVTSGTLLMQHIVDKFRNALTEDMIEPDMSLKDPGDDKRYHPDFKWEGKEFVIDNMDTFTKNEVLRKPPKVILFFNSPGGGMGPKAQRVKLPPG